MCEHLEIPVVEPWLTNAANSVYKVPNARSDRQDWATKWFNQMDWRVIDRWSYFERYRK